MINRDQSNLFLTLDALIPANHPYRRLERLLPFDQLSQSYHSLYSYKGRKEKGAEFALRALVLQFHEDLSDREMERFLQENLSGKWFCDLGLGEKAPDHSYFGEFRKRLGTKRLMDIFSQVRDSLHEMGLVKEGFTFVDSSCQNRQIEDGYAILSINCTSSYMVRPALQEKNSFVTKRIMHPYIRP